MKSRFSRIFSVRGVRALHLGLSPWMIMGMAIILGLTISALAVRSNQRGKTYMIQNLLDRAEAPAGPARIEALSARAIAAMLLKGAKDARPALDALAAEMDGSIRHGVLRGRCPEALLTSLSLLGWVKATAAEPQSLAFLARGSISRER